MIPSLRIKPLLWRIAPHLCGIVPNWAAGRRHFVYRSAKDEKHGKIKDMISDDALYLQAMAVLNPRRLSPSTEAGSVASALVTEAGNIYTGVCIIAGSGMGFCAEHSAIAAMVTNGENRIATIVAVHYDGEYFAPCGRCREFIFQMHPDNSTTRVLLSGGRSSTIAALLPER